MDHRKIKIMDEVGEYIDDLLAEIDELNEQIKWYQSQLNQLREQYGEFGLDYPENYSLAQMTDIIAAIQAAM